jgi:hypothetical protein
MVGVVSIVGFGFIIGQGNGWAVAIGIYNTGFTSVDFLAFLPILLIAAVVLVTLQRRKMETQHIAGSKNED